MNETNGFMSTVSYMPPRKKPLEKGERSAAGGSWFVAVLPLIGLFLELFATDKYAGAALWLAVIVMMYLGCIADFRHIRHEMPEAQEDSLKWLPILPPIYLIARGRVRPGEAFKGVLMMILMAAAVFANGFTQGMALDEEKMPPTIENTWVSNLSNFSGSSDSLVSERLTEWFDEGYSTDCSRSGDEFTIVFSGTHEDVPAEVTITVVHDGFAYQTLEASDVTIDGKKQEDDDLKEILAEIFIGETEDDEEGESSEEE